MTLFGKFIFSLLLVVVGGSFYYGVTSYVKHDSDLASVSISTTTKTIPENASSSDTSSTTKVTGKKVPFTKVLERGGSYTCTVNQTVANMTSTGTVYIHDSLIKATFSMTVAGNVINSSMIVRDGYTYAWTDKSLGKGTKVKMVKNSEESTTTPSAVTWNGEQVGDYTCEEWIADDNIFVLPKNITFTVAN